MNSIINCNGYYDLHFESIIIVNQMNVTDFGSPSDTPVSIAVNTDKLEVYSDTIKYTPSAGPIEVPNPCGGEPIVVDYVDLDALCISGPIHFVVGVPTLETSLNVVLNTTDVPPITPLSYATSGGDVSLVGQTIQIVDSIPQVLPNPIVTVTDANVVSMDEIEDGYCYRVFGTFRISLD